MGRFLTLSFYERTYPFPFLVGPHALLHHAELSYAEFFVDDDSVRRDDVFARNSNPGPSAFFGDDHADRFMTILFRQQNLKKKVAKCIRD